MIILYFHHDYKQCSAKLIFSSQNFPQVWRNRTCIYEIQNFHIFRLSKLWTATISRTYLPVLFHNYEKLPYLYLIQHLFVFFNKCPMFINIRTKSYDFCNFFVFNFSMSRNLLILFFSKLTHIFPPIQTKSPPVSLVINNSIECEKISNFWIIRFHSPVSSISLSSFWQLWPKLIIEYDLFFELWNFILTIEKSIDILFCVHVFLLLFLSPLCLFAL